MKLQDNSLHKNFESFASMNHKVLKAIYIYMHNFEFMFSLMKIMNCHQI